MMHVCETRYPTARRDRTCDLCARTIQAGTRYARTPVMHDGSWRQWYEHVECRAEVLRLMDGDGEDSYPLHALVYYHSSEDWSPEYAAFYRSLLCPDCRDAVRIECEVCSGRAWVRHGESYARCSACDGRGHLACETCGGWDGH